VPQRLDVDNDGEITIEDARHAVRRSTPFVTRHPGLSGSLVGGFVAGYRLL